MLVTAFLHFARSYFLSAYKSPRELVWCTGVLLGLVLIGFAFTGGLLPYDQRAYWAAMVGIRIAASAPIIGDAFYDLMTGGYDGIGTTTMRLPRNTVRIACHQFIPWRSSPLASM